MNKLPRDPDFSRKGHVVAWFKANSARFEPVKSLIEFLINHYQDDSNHGYINKKSQNVYLFGSSYAKYGSARVIFSKSHSLVQFWVDEPLTRLTIPIGEVVKTLKSKTSTDLHLVEFKVLTEDDFSAIQTFIRKNRVPGWQPELMKSDNGNQSNPYSHNIVNSEEDAKKFENEVAKSLKDSEKIRQSRLDKAPKIPTKYVASIERYIRNPDVVAQVLSEANGVCAKCGNTPFKRISNNLPYLEVHHIDPLSKGGEDSVGNAEALCPNCHRQRHDILNSQKS